MEIQIYTFIATASFLVVVSYIYSIISEKLRIPSVLLLLLTGICIKILSTELGFNYSVSDGAVELVGSIGLILILLDAGLDLNLSKAKLPIVKRAAFSSLLVLLMSVIGIAVIFHELMGASWAKSLVLATPLSIISSAVVAEGVRELSVKKREFLNYESALSDVFGVILFGYLVSTGGVEAFSLLATLAGIFVALVLSVFLSLAMIWVVTRVDVKVKTFLIFAFLFFVYSLGNIYKFPSLIIVLVFGLVMNNWERLRSSWTSVWASRKIMRDTSVTLFDTTLELSFLVRAFFFILFGYTIDISYISNQKALMVGGLILIIIYFVRFIYLWLFAKSHILPELFYTPRGLVTLLLFYRIPAEFSIGRLEEGILLIVVLATALVFMGGNIISPDSSSVDPQQKRRP